MKIAVTADTHLTTRAKNAERFNALQNILSQLQEKEIGHLIVAGDLFDQGTQDYSEFEALCREHSQIQFHIVPGNHDPAIRQDHIVVENVHVYSEPEVVFLDPEVPILFVPYELGLSMGESIAAREEQIKEQKWVLVGHGDYYGGVKERNPHEPGTYMPLARKDIERFRPRTVLLGHIHKSISIGNIHYPGSPCGLDINETGKRTFLVFDTDSQAVEHYEIDTDVLFFNESFVVLPHEDEIADLRQRIQERIGTWGIGEKDYEKVQVRVTATGYSSNRSAILNTLKDGFSRFAFYGGEHPSTDQLFVSEDQQLLAIATKTRERIEHLSWGIGEDEPDKDEILRVALSVIYGEEGR